MGIDPGLAVMGWGAIRVVGRRASYVDSGVIRSAAKTARVERLREVADGARRAAADLSPDLICVERVFVNVNRGASLSLGEARGAALAALLLFGSAPVVEISALQVKRAVTGLGRAGKLQVAEMVGRILEIDVAGMPADCADALACALAGAQASAVGALGEGAGDAVFVGRRRYRRRAASRRA